MPGPQALLLLVTRMRAVHLLVVLSLVALSSSRYCVDCQSFLGCLLTCPRGGGQPEE